MSRAPANPQRSLVLTTRRAISPVIVGLILAGSLVMSRHARDGIATPSYWLLALFSFSLVVPFQATFGVVLQKILATYLLTLGVDYLSGVYWPLADNLQVAAGLAVAAVTILAAWIAPRRRDANDGSADLAVAAGVAVAILGTLLLAAGCLVHHWYGFGAERSLGVGGQIALALLTGIAAWRLAHGMSVRLAIGLAGTAAYVWMGVSR